MIEINKWIVAINKAVTGNDIELELEQDIKEIDNSILGAFREMKRELNEAFYGPSNNVQQAQPVTPSKVTGKCKYCGAPISGKKDQIVRCSYCDGERQL